VTPKQINVNVLEPDQTSGQMCRCLHLLRCTFMSDVRMYAGGEEGKVERRRRIDRKKTKK
jgi:hypothetical protein